MMALNSPTSFLVLIIFLSFCLLSSAADGNKRLHVVYMGEKHHEDPDVVTALHHDTLASVLGSKEAALEAIVYSYRHGFSGFAAMLTDHEAKLLSRLPGILRVKPSGILRVHTTRSWDFLRLSTDQPNSLLKKSNFGDGVIVGVVDSGIWPESPSFNDEGYGLIPERWKGTCQTGESFDESHCNRKIIGARYYAGSIDKSILDHEYKSPRDNIGHGTHCASTLAGSPVENASFHGLGVGTARGGAPMARLAIYKVAWGNGTFNVGNDASLLKAVDDAIHDGVDVLSLSVTLTEGSWAILRAVMKGITIVYAAGNDGPTPQSVENMAPWVITAAATTMDRSFPTAITLGNNRTIIGQALYYEASKAYENFIGIIDGSTCDEDILRQLNTSDVVGKFVLCAAGTKPADSQFLVAVEAVYEAQGAGVIFAQYPTHRLEVLPIPCIKVDFEMHQQILEYIGNTSYPMVKVSPTWSAEGQEVLAPIVASFSSRGPSKIFPGILKPDIAAPGVNILAAVENSYKFKTGTSMSTPAVSGIVALIKAIHPSWSPAAIKSALVTTASTTDDFGLPILAEGVPRKVADPFDYGGGLVNPNRVAGPGLVYDIDPEDYEEFHCTWEYILLCQTSQRPVYHLNLPSISIPNLEDEVKVWRTVTNVGPPEAEYRAFVEAPAGVEVVVEPPRLVFNERTRWHSFMVTFRALRKVQGVYSFGSLTWFDGGTHRVRTPIAVRTVILDSFSDTG